MKKKCRSALAVTTPGRQVQTKGPATKEEQPSWVRVGRHRSVGLVRPRKLFLFQPRGLSSSPVAIGRVVAPGCFSPFLLSSRASRCCPVTGCGCPAPGTQVSKLGTGHRRGTVVVCHDSPRRASHTGMFESPMPDRKPVSVCTSQSSWNFRLATGLWLKSMVSRRFLVDVASAIRCCAQSLRRQGRWDGCATLASSPSAAYQSSDRLHALATMFVSIWSPFRNQMLASCGGRFSRLVRANFLQDVLLGRTHVAPADDV